MPKLKNAVSSMVRITATLGNTRDDQTNYSSQPRGRNEDADQPQYRSNFGVGVRGGHSWAGRDGGQRRGEDQMQRARGD